MTNETSPITARKTFIGTVSSDKNAKTITVVVETSKKHPRYGKSFKSTKKYHVHDENNLAHVGDKVEIIETRPLSALKRFRLLKVINSNYHPSPTVEADSNKE